MSRIVGVLFAAGSAQRFGKHKLLAELSDGEAVTLRAARNLIQIVPGSLAVVRPGDRGARHLLEGAGSDLRLVGTTDDGILQDVDMPSDLVSSKQGGKSDRPRKRTRTAKSRSNQGKNGKCTIITR